MKPEECAHARRRSHVLAFAAGLIVAAFPVQAAPKVVATIAPVHSLVSGVMAGVAAPGLLLPGGASPHSYALKPSDARMLATADLIVAVGPTLESFLEKPLAHLARRARIVMLMHDAGIDLLTTSGHHHDQASRTDANPHIWLDPANAIRIVDRVATVLAELDSANAGRYRSNQTATIARLRALDRSLEATLAPVRGTPFMASHDAYAYLVSRYGLNMVGAFHPTPERAPGARHLSALRKRMARLGVRCVFSEPQFASRTVAASVRRAGARSAVLDPLGADITPGPAAYGIVMRRLAAALAGCLLER
jgi:zinc transport system substrate-binding protein